MIRRQNSWGMTCHCAKNVDPDIGGWPEEHGDPELSV